MKNLKLICVVLFIGIYGIVFSQNDFNTKKIAVFKNGTGFFIKSGKIDASEGNYIFKQTPKALFGSLWVSAMGEQVKSLHTLQDKSVEQKNAEKISDLLIGNINKKAKIILYSGSDYDATIVDVQNDIVTLQTKDKWVTTDISSVKTIEFYEKPNLTYDHKTDANQLSVEFNSNGKKDLNLMYLQKGIGWFPSYLVEIDDNNNAEITLKSTLINDVEDIENTELSFVVGVPSFKYNYIESPLTSNVTLLSFVSSLNAGAYRSYNSFDNSGALSNAIMTQSIAPNNTYNNDASYFVDDTEFASDFTNQEDLYFYKHKNVTLKKGDRATYNLLKTNVDFEHIYDVTINPNGTNYYSYSKTYSDPAVNKVWHSIKLKNSSKMPWTTGTAMVVKNDKDGIKPISQDMMKYTPIGSDTYLKVTISPDISVKERDKEIKRVEKSKKKNSDYYDLVTVEGSIVVKNFKKKEIKLNIKRNMSGTLLTSNVEWDFTKLPNSYYYYINPMNSVIWDLKLKAGEEKEIKYSYTIYIYH